MKYVTVDPIRVHHKIQYGTQQVVTTTVSLPVEYLGKKDRLRGYGVAIQHPNDEPDEDVGMGLALARALENLAALLRVVSGTEKDDV